MDKHNDNLKKSKEGDMHNAVQAGIKDRYNQLVGIPFVSFANSKKD